MDIVDRDDSTKLLWSVAQQLKTPLSIISRQAELASLTGQYSLQDASNMRVQADIGLALVDCYLLGLDLWQKQAELDLEAVSLSSIMADTSQYLYRYAKQMNVDLDLQVEGKFGPVMANARGVRAAMLSLGCTLVETVQTTKQRRLTLAIHRSEGKIVAGMYGISGSISPSQWNAGQELKGRAGQPMSAMYGSGAGLFVAHSILQAMGSQLDVGRHVRQSGLKASFIPSHQLSFL